MKRRLLNLFTALDQFVYVLLTLGYGYPDETLSSAAWRAEQKGRVFGRVFRPVIDALLRPIERDHCYQAYLAERRRLQFPRELR